MRREEYNQLLLKNLLLSHPFLVKKVYEMRKMLREPAEALKDLQGNVTLRCLEKVRPENMTDENLVRRTVVRQAMDEFSDFWEHRQVLVDFESLNENFLQQPEECGGQAAAVPGLFDYLRQYLSPPEYDLLWLKIVDGLSYRSIADYFPNTTEDALRHRWNRLKCKIRNLILQQKV